jgi:hypothetical protein
LSVLNTAEIAVFFVWRRVEASRGRDDNGGCSIVDYWSSGKMGKFTRVTCKDCYFRREGLCALPGDTPCPTFRATVRGGLAPPLQPRLVLRQIEPLAVRRVAA